MTVQIDGMTCGGCAAAVQASLSQLKGVSQARVSFEEKSATVQYDPSLLTMDQIQEAVENAGYKATVKR
jgi:copper chaperone CopZ